MLIAAALAAVTVPVLGGIVAADRPVRVWPSIPASAIVAGVLQWTSSRIADVPLIPSIGLAVVAVVLVAQFAIDVTVHRLPRELSYAGLIVFLLTIPFADTGVGRLPQTLVGSLVMVAIALGIVVWTKGSLGMGDVHLAPLLGAIVGWFGFLVAIALAWAVTALTGGVVVAIGLTTGRLRRSDHVPYGPFLILGTLATCISMALVHR